MWAIRGSTVTSKAIVNYVTVTLNNSQKGRTEGSHQVSDPSSSIFLAIQGTQKCAKIFCDTGI